MDKRHIFRSIGRALKDFRKNNRGVSAVIVAFLAIPIFGFVGLSVDLGRAYVLKSKLSTALDAAGLAAGRNIFSPDAEIYADAQKYFDANFPSGYMGTSPITMDSTTVTWDSDKETISLAVSADMNTTFMNVLNHSTLTVGALTEIKRDNRGMELVLVLDNTGSMGSSLGSGTRLSELKTSANNLIDILYGTDETRDKLWVGVVPYTTQVNVGPQNINFMSNADRNNILSNSSSIFTADNNNNTALGRDVTGDSVNDTVYGWEGCVEMREDLDGGTKDVSDDPPANDFIPYFYSSDEAYDERNKWVTNGVNSSGSRGPNKYCPPPILPLTAEKTTIKSAINSMVDDGATGIQVGMVWGWRAISPRWNNHWYDSSTLNLPVGYTALPLNYGEEYIDKVVILMTDGVNTLGTYGIYHAYARQKEVGIALGDSGFNPLYHTSGEGVLTENHNDAYYEALDDAKTLAACTAMKNAGIIVYTVLLINGNSSMMSSCATSSKHAFVATSAADLADDFATIGEELSNLRLSK